MDASDRKRFVASEAAHWFARLESGELALEQRELFVEWLRESPLHIAEMLRIAQIHGSLEGFHGWSRIVTGPKTEADNVIPLHVTEDGVAFPQGRGHPARAPISAARRASSRRLTYAGLAAMLLLAVGAMLALPRIRGHVIETERGERREIVLADGSQIQVDPETRLRVKYTDTVRQVLLERGRALFRVARSPNKPFLVQVDNTTVRALGTAFGVEEHGDDVIVTVSEGKVAVSARGSAQITDVLTADQQLMVHPGLTAEPVKQVDSARALAWATGRLIFQNEEISHVVAEFNRYNHVQLTVADPELARKPVSGVFNAAEPEAFIAFLQSVTSVDIARDGDKTITIGVAPHP